MRILMMLAFVSGGLTLAGCDVPEPESVSASPSLVTETVQFEGSDVQVSWDPAAKTSATLVYDSRLSIWSNAAADLIAEATGCSADPSFMSFPDSDEGSKAVAMPIRCT